MQVEVEQAHGLIHRTCATACMVSQLRKSEPFEDPKMLDPSGVLGKSEPFGNPKMLDLNGVLEKSEPFGDPKMLDPNGVLGKSEPFGDWYEYPNIINIESYEYPNKNLSYSILI